MPATSKCKLVVRYVESCRQIYLARSNYFMFVLHMQLWTLFAYFRSFIIPTSQRVGKFLSYQNNKLRIVLFASEVYLLTYLFYVKAQTLGPLCDFSSFAILF